ncbi:hypothetical protein Syun_012543 [Stephania yunnanensis]|uniref:C3H1-type domain-containing protein n=1 Tax=Stephania yunnanensis TaxID=152371 RepID=A0AAP0JZL3_9MAGN
MGVSDEGPRRLRWPDQRTGTVMHQEGNKDKQLGPQVVEAAAAPGGARVVGSRQSQILELTKYETDLRLNSNGLGASPPEHAWRRRLNSHANLLREFSVTFREAVKMYFLKTGVCKFGVACKFHHPRDKQIATQISLNMLGLPMRQPIEAKFNNAIAKLNIWLILVTGILWRVGWVDYLWRGGGSDSWRATEEGGRRRSGQRERQSASVTRDGDGVEEDWRGHRSKEWRLSVAAAEVVRGGIRVAMASRRNNDERAEEGSPTAVEE